MKRLWGIIVVMVVAGLALTGATVRAQSTNWTITEFVSTLTVQEDGRLDVVEDVSVNFGAEQLHGIYRDLPVVYEGQDAKHYTLIDVVDVTMDDGVVEQKITRNAANMRIRVGDPDRTISGIHRYRVHYVVSGALLSFENYDEVYWNITGNEWAVPILASRAEVRLPRGSIVQASCYAGPTGANRACGSYIVTDENSVAIFQHPETLAGGEGLTVAVGYKKGAVPIIVVPAPTTLADIITGSPTAGVVFVATLIAGVATLIYVWRRRGRDLRLSSRHEAIIVEYEPPDRLRPAELGVLMNERTDTLAVSATVVDLAVRGYLEITEVREKKWWRGADYELARKKAPDAALMQYETLLLEGLFKTGEVVKVSDLKMKFYKDLEAVTKELYEHVVAKKFFTGNPNNVRTYHAMGAVLLMVVGIGAIVVSVPPSFSDSMRSVLIGFGPALFITSFFYLFTAVKGMPQRTAEGRALYIKARGYKEYITHVETYRQRFFERENTFMEVLPYAMIFGATKKLADAMKHMGVTPPPQTWYHGVGAFNMAAFSSSINSFSASLSTTMASSPSSSGSGGGGSSGGGGGGGGGGGW